MSSPLPSPDDNDNPENLNVNRNVKSAGSSDEINGEIGELHHINLDSSTRDKGLLMTNRDELDKILDAFHSFKIGRTKDEPYHYMDTAEAKAAIERYAATKAKAELLAIVKQAPSTDIMFYIEDRIAALDKEAI